MHSKYQRGELSLFWTAVFVGVVALAAMVALMSARYERNYFAEAWKRLMETEAGQVLQQTQQAAASAANPDTAVRKCMVDGKVVYSNVECGAGNSSSRKVELHDTKGFEAPKAPAAAAPEADASANLKEKMVEKAVQR
ncbi:MAG: hypothetical protein ACREX0_07165 [Noviherbaspirillum sp.]